MARHKLKPNLDLDKEMEELVNEVCEYFGEAYDDRYNYEHKSVRDIAKLFNVSPAKIRKILITAGKYSTEISRTVNELYNNGKSKEEIAEILNMTRASVYSYLPYKKHMYNMPVKSVGADRTAKWRKRNK